jgi:MarR family transcriptional regulator for hemolysin
MPDQTDLIHKNFAPLVAQAARQWRRVLDRALQPLGLTEATWLPLVHVARADQPPRQKDLAAALQLDNSSVVRLLDALQGAGLIERTEGSDRRAKTVTLTDAGRVIVDQVEQVAAAARARYLGALPAGDLAIAFRVMQQWTDVLAAGLEQPE